MSAAPRDARRLGELIYDYHRMHMPIHPRADVIFCLCSLDTRVARCAAELFREGRADFLIFSGGAGKLTRARFNKPEAEVFADIALGLGVPGESIVVEPHSTNTGENVRFTHALLQQKRLCFRSFILVQKPYMERRTYATFKKQWPDPDAEFTVTSPPLSWDQYPDEHNPRDLVINIMVGDLIRIREYPARAFQIAQDIPPEVWGAGQQLIQDGFDGHLP